MAVRVDPGRDNPQKSTPCARGGGTRHISTFFFVPHPSSYSLARLTYGHKRPANPTLTGSVAEKGIFTFFDSPRWCWVGKPSLEANSTLAVYT